MKENGPLLSILLILQKSSFMKYEQGKDEEIIFRPFPNPYCL